MSPRHSVFLLYFLLGAYAVCAQATLLRETQVVLFGSELSWGLVLAFWLAGVAAGARLGGYVLNLMRRHWVALTVSSLAMPLLLVVAVSFIRASRLLLGSGPGEYLGFTGLVLVAATATIPVSLWIGLAFPTASTLLSDLGDKSTHKAQSIGWVYMTESAGSLFGGALYSFLLVSSLDAYSLIVGGGVALALGSSYLARVQSPLSKTTSGALLFWACALTGVVSTDGASKLDKATVLLRWRSFAPNLELVTSENSLHQNIAIGRLESQFSLYTNGAVTATWPDHSTLAVEAHLAACQHPDPRRVLVLGGGVEGILKELLRHDPESLDYVTLDSREHEIVVKHLVEPDFLAIEDVRTRVHLEDARRFVKRAAEAGGTPYDLVILTAPQPTSAMLARLYTAEFFAELYRIMAADGVLAFSLTGSVGAWRAEVSNYVGSIAAPLERVFAEVLLTFGDPVRIFAGKQAGVITGSGTLLAERYNARQVTSPFFSPIWFEGASDFLDPEKRELVRNALTTHPPRHINSDTRPVAALYRLRLWSATTGAGRQREHELVPSILEIRLWWVFAAVSACVVVVVLVALARGSSAMRQTALLWAVGTTGFTAMSIEIVLLYTLQVLCGYVYGMIGLAIGVFMFGLVVGSAVMNCYMKQQTADGAERQSLKIVVALDVLLVLFAAALPAVLGLLRNSAGHPAAQTALFSLIGVMGVLGGMVIPIAALIRLHDHANTARAASAVDAADHSGAGVGALVTGVVLVPVLGISGTCLAVAFMKGLSALFVAGAAIKG